MPAVRAAESLAPTARISKPIVLRSSTHHTATAARIATTTPRWVSATLGNTAEPSTLGDCGLSLPGRWKASLLSAYSSTEAAR